MGRVAHSLSTRTGVTDDNPRSESPQQIVEHILAGMKPPVTVIHDRREAIAEAIGSARPGDLVLVAGKGHEQTQTSGNEVIPMSDRVIVAETLEALA
jgi:UDP-N-acetylmuramyl tripeptide synthase